MSRELTEHERNYTNRVLRVLAIDEPGHGGANHIYSIQSLEGNIDILNFQNGPIKEVGNNGTTNEALLAIVLDRLRAFQGSEFTKNRFSCRENAMAITKIEEALMWLNKRTQEREARGVEGTLKP